MLIDVEDIDAFLEHHGVKGMKWGTRRAVRRENRAAKKQVRQEFNAARNAQIQSARTRFKTGQARADYKVAKAAVKMDKGNIEARRILENTKAQNRYDYAVSRQTKSGKEATVTALLSVGLIGISALAIAASHR